MRWNMIILMENAPIRRHSKQIFVPGRGYHLSGQELTIFSSTADAEWDGLLDGRPALDALLHDDGTAVASHHVKARLEQDRGR